MNRTMSDPITTLSATIVAKITIASIISAIAGAINTVLQLDETKRNELTVSEWFRDIFLFGVVHAVSAMSIGLLLKSFIYNEYLLFGLIGVGGLLGTKAIFKILTNVLEKFLIK